MRKKFIIGVLNFFLLFTLCACGSSNMLNPKNSINGFWTDGDITKVAIEEERGFLVRGSTVYKCTVDTDEKTITVQDYSWDDSDTEFSYEFVNGELKLTTDNDQALGDSTLVLSKDKDTLSLQNKDDISGKWTNQNMTTLSIDGNSGFLTWGSSDYSCEVNPEEKTISVKEYSWDKSDVEYSYEFVYGRLILSTSNDQALSDSSILLIPQDVADRLETQNSDQKDKEQKKTEEESSAKSKEPSIEGANELSSDYYVIGEDIEPGIYDFGPTIDEDGDEYFSIEIYDNKEYYDQSEGDAEGTDYLDHYKSYYGEDVQRGVSLKKGNVLVVDYHGVLYKKQ